MADDWQLEAVHEQFRGKRSLQSFSYFSEPKNIKDLVETVQNAISQHRRAPLKLKAHSSERQIASQIIEAASDGDSNNYPSFKYSFIVIVANQEVNNRLWKLPIFVVELLNGARFFVDLNCSVYKSWKAFLQNNDLPPCEFCYPVDGKYSDQLKIDYAKSPSASSVIVQSFFSSVGFKVISAVCVAGTFFFKIAKCALECAIRLVPIAKKLIPVLSKCSQILMRVETLIARYVCGSIGITELTKAVFGLLDQCNSLLCKDFVELWIEIKKCFGSAYDHLKDQYGFRSSGSGEEAQSIHQVMAMTYKTDSELKDIKKNADKQVLESVKHNHTINRYNSTSLTSQNYVQNILDQSKKDYENYSCTNKKDFSQETYDLVKISADIAKHVQGTQSESIHSDTFEALSDTFKKSYEQKLDIYKKMVNAAEKGAGHKIDLEAFNAELGIKGDYKEHYWNETIHSELNQGRKLGEQIRLKMSQLKSQKPMMIHPITEQDHSVNHEGIFLWKSHKEIQDKDVLSALEENIELRFKEEDLVINHTECNIVIRDRHYIIFVYQSDKGSQEGLILIMKFKE